MAERKVQIRVSVDDLDAGKRLDALAAKLDKLTKKIWNIRVRLDDGGAAAKLDKMVAKLEKMSAKTYTPKIKTDGITKADAELDKFNLKLDRISHRRVTATVHVRTSGGKLNTVDALLKDIFGGGGGGGGNLQRDLGNAASGGGGLGGGALSALAGANNSYMGGLIATLVAYATAIAPAVIPFGIGGLTGIGGGVLAGMLGTKGSAALLADRQALAQARAALAGKGANTPSQELALRQAQAQLARDQARYGGFAPFGHQVNAFANNALGSLAGAMTARGPGYSGGGPGGTAGAPSFLQGLTPILGQLGGFFKSNVGNIGATLRASLPFVSAFVKIFIQLANVMGPVLTQSMKQFTPYIPIMVQGFKLFAQGLAGFIVDLGPGMRDAAVIFKGSMEVVKGFLQLTGFAASKFAIAIVDSGRFVRAVAKGIPPAFDKMRHDVANIFDGVRHDIAHYWDVIWQDTIGRITRGVQDVMNWDARLRHGIASDYDALRAFISHEWDQIWSNTVGRVERGVSDVENWFHKLPGGIKSALNGIGSTLWSLAKNWLLMIVHGAQSMASSVLNFFKGLGAGILHAIGGLFHFGSPSKTMFKYGAWIVQGLERGMQSRMSHIKGVSGSIASMVMQVLKASGKPMSWLPAISRLVQLESGGNPRAVNPISVDGQHATGMFQMLPSTFAAYGGRGSMFNWLTEGIAAMRYISATYGSPMNIPGLFSGGYQGYAKGGPIVEPIFGMGLRSGKAYGFGENGIHEDVIPRGSGGAGGTTIILNVAVPHSANPDGTARAIQQMLKDLKRHNGGAALGLS